VNVRHLVLAIGALALGGLLGAGPCAALENLRVFRGVLVLEGKIEPGDYIAVRNFLRNESNFKKISGGVFLASPGGYVREAMKIGDLIRELRLSTDAPSIPPAGKRGFGGSVIRQADLVNPGHYQCISACFLVYVAGIDRNLNWTGRLGIHRPRLQQKSVELSENEIANANIGIRNTIKRYLQRMDVPEKYLDLMFSISPDGVRWISQDEFDADLKGYIPEMRALLNERCNPRPSQIKIDLRGLPAISLESEVKTLSAKQSGELFRCLADFRNELSAEAWRKVFRHD
jgi:hypothetical protein